MQYCFILAFAAFSLARASDYYAAPSGTGGDGSLARPWTLAQGFNNSVVQPGDTLWLRGGVYAGTFTSTLKGSASKPIIVRQYPGERATLDGGSSGDAVLTIQGGWTWYWGFEVINSSPQRTLRDPGSWNPENARGTGVNIYGVNVKCINLIVHDTSLGFGFWSGTGDSELYGNLVYNNGWEAPDRGHGHGIYAQNDQNTKRVVNNVIFNQFGYGIHIFGSSAAFLNNFVVEDNTSFDNGLLSRTTGFTMNLLLGGGSVAQSPTVMDNDAYFDPKFQKGENNIGYNAGCTDLTFAQNYFVAPMALRLIACKPATITQSTFVGAIQGFAPDGSNVVTTTLPPLNRVVVRPNSYEPGRAWITVFNWENKSSVSADVSKVLTAGDRYIVRDAENYFGAPVASGVYNGGGVTLPMLLEHVALPIGDAPVVPDHTAPQFAAFSLERVAAGPPPAVAAGISQAVPVSTPIRLNGMISGAGSVTAAWAATGPNRAVAFANPADPATTATFSKPGLYTLTLSAQSNGQTASDQVPVLAYAAAPADPPGTIRVNAGGPQYRDMTGLTWSADTGFDSGSPYVTPQAIPLSAEPDLYANAHWSAAPFSYNFNVANGSYAVILKFAEIWFTQPGERTFDVSINGTNVLSHFDMLASAGGPRVPVDVCIPVSITAGSISMLFTPVVSNPAINGIAILPGGQCPATPRVARHF